MEKQIPQKDLILEIVGRFSEGASLEEILIGLTPAPSSRTLRYRLASMVKEGLLVATGATKGRRYCLPVKTDEGVPLPPPKDTILLSRAAESIQLEVTRPIQSRRHVSYNREFLDQYRPNVTYYLSESVRKRLFDVGKTDGDRPAGTYARQIFNRLLIDLSWNSSRLEGNTYSLLETERLLSSGVAAEGKDQRETQMILNHKAAIEFLIDSTPELALSRYSILNLHALLSDNLLPDPACGSLRTISVGIGGSVYIPLSVPQLVSECFQQIIDTAAAIKNPFEQSFFLMVHLPYLQPFEDVNKRVSRLAANIPLIRENLSPLSFIDVPEQTYINGLIGVYELNRVELFAEIFVWAYERSASRYSATRKALGDPDPFRLRYRDIIKETVGAVVKECMDKKIADAFIRKKAVDLVPTKDQKQFIEVVETIVTSLHEGNVGRYRVTLKEYEKWSLSWR